jgi:tetratricopeptide (TPR) repeat protein
MSRMENARALHDRPAVPLLGMIIDRTSFDETDDYGVDRDALESTSWSKDKTDRLPVHPVVMKNGKVRRRLRWRPKNMMKQRRPRPAASQITGPSNMHSSNASVSSSANSSQVSRSGKSVHSFASTETATLNNTKAGKQRLGRFPLPRPNYSDTFAGVATIGSEGGLVHARMLPGKGSVDSSVDSPASGTADSEAGTFDPYGSENPKRNLRKPGLPPLFNRRKKQQRVKGSPHKSLADSPQPSSELTMERTVRDLLTPRSKDSHSSSLASGSDVSAGVLPKLNSEEMELERRVDLCIRRPAERRESLGSVRSQQPRNTNYNDGTKARPIDVDDLAVLNDLALEELRAESEVTSSVESTPRRATARPLPSQSRNVSQDSTQKKDQERMKEDQERMRSSADPTLFPSYSTPENKCDDTDLLRLKSSRSAPLVSPPTPKALVASAPIHSNSSHQREEEIQFSMSVPVIYEDERSPPSSPKFMTGPVDVDDGCFLEVEKNLEAIHEMAAEHLQHGEYTEALEVFEEILRGQLARYGQDHYRVGTALHNIGIVHMKRGDNVNAAKVCKEAVRVRKIALGSFHQDVAVSLAQLGVAYMETEKHAKAITVFREALRIRRKCLGPRHPKVAKILNNIGCALYELKELEVAKVAFEEALAVQRHNLRETQSDSPEFSDQSLLSIASTLSNLGSIKLYWGQHHEAAIDLEAVLLLQQSVLGDEHPVAQRTQDSLTWVENARDLGVTPPSLLQLSGSLSEKKSSESQMEAIGIAYCSPAVDISMDHSELSGPFEALERRLKLLNLDFGGCGMQDMNDSDVSEADFSASQR